MSNQTKEQRTDIFDRVAELFLKSAASQKRVTNVDKMKDDVDKLFKYIRYFSLLNQDDTVVIMGSSIKTLDQIPILNEVKDFIAPASVKLLAGNRRMVELIHRSMYCKFKMEELVSLQYSEYIEILNRFRGYFKKDASDNIVTLASLKKELALMDILSLAANSTGNVNYDSDPFFPIFIKLGKEDILGDFLQDNADAMIEDYCSKIRF